MFDKFVYKKKKLKKQQKNNGVCHGCDRMVVTFTTTYAISAYYH